MTKLRRNQLTTAALVVCATFGSASLGQSSNQSPAPSTVISLNFPGGTVAQYVDAIKKQSGEVNVLLDEQSRNIQMPAVALTSVNIPSALELMDDRTHESDGLLVKLDVRTISPQDPSGRPIYYVYAQTGRSQGRTHSTVISVKDILGDGYEADDVMTAVATTIELLAAGAEPAEIRFHEQTGLLIARGGPDQIGAIHQVIDQIRESINRDGQAGSMEMNAQRYYQQTIEMKEQLTARSAEINDAIQRMTEARTRAELFEKELEKMRRAMEEREQQIMQSELRIRMLQEELAKLERAANKGNS